MAKKRIDLGERIAGFKAGCTSSAIRAQFGLNEPVLSKLFRPHTMDIVIFRRPPDNI